MFDVIALGEILIDFTPINNKSFQKNPGGAPANVAVCLSKLGGQSSFIGKVGNDIFGKYLIDILNKNKVNTSNIILDNNYNTTLAFVQLNNGDRDFSFYRNPGADTMLEISEINFESIKNSKIFHFGSLSLTDEPSKTTTLKVLDYAKNNGLIISYDPNLRLPLWKSKDHALKEIISVLNKVDILKISEEELIFITNIPNIGQAVDILYNEYKIKTILVTLGNKGCFYKNNNKSNLIPSFNVNTIDITGAGDVFLGTFLYYMNKMDIEKAITLANANAALSTTKRGAIPSIPNKKQLNNFLKNYLQ